MGGQDPASYRDPATTGRGRGNVSDVDSSQTDPSAPALHHEQSWAVADPWPKPRYAPAVQRHGTAAPWDNPFWENRPWTNGLSTDL